MLIFGKRKRQKRESAREKRACICINVDKERKNYKCKSRVIGIERQKQRKGGIKRQINIEREGDKEGYR